MTRFRFKQFAVDDSDCGMKVGTDGVLLGAWARVEHPGLVLDAGTGSGVVALMLAQRYPQATLIGIDNSLQAWQVARNNFDRSPWGRRVGAFWSDFCCYCPPSGVSVGTVVCNPPYFKEGKESKESKESKEDKARREARQERTLSVATLMGGATRLLVPGGSLAMITPADRAEEVDFHAALFRLSLWRRTDVVTVEGKQPKRVLWQFVYNPREMPSLLTPVTAERDTLTLRYADGEYTPQYAALVRDFYLNM